VDSQAVPLWSWCFPLTARSNQQEWYGRQSILYLLHCQSPWKYVMTVTGICYVYKIVDCSCCYIVWLEQLPMYRGSFINAEYVICLFFSWEGSWCWRNNDTRERKKAASKPSLFALKGSLKNRWNLGIRNSWEEVIAMEKRTWWPLVIPWGTLYWKKDSMLTGLIQYKASLGLKNLQSLFICNIDREKSRYPQATILLATHLKIIPGLVNLVV
jgi:hypothetical protein